MDFRAVFQLQRLPPSSCCASIERRGSIILKIPIKALDPRPAPALDPIGPGTVAFTTIGSSPQRARMIATPCTPMPIMAPVFEQTILPCSEWPTGMARSMCSTFPAHKDN